MYGIEYPSKAFFRIGQMVYDLEKTYTDSIILLFTHARVYEALRWYLSCADDDARFLKDCTDYEECPGGEGTDIVNCSSAYDAGWCTDIPDK